MFMVKAVELDIKLQLPKATTHPLPRPGAPSIDLARPTRVTAWRENAQMDAEGSVRRGRCSKTAIGGQDGEFCHRLDD
jgi:hypothetical protein